MIISGNPTWRITHHHGFLEYNILWILKDFTLNLMTGGNCWLNVNRNGRCTALVKAGTTKEDCCNRGPLAATASAAWNEQDMTPSSLFYMHVQGGVTCSRCKGNKRYINWWTFRRRAWLIHIYEDQCGESGGGIYISSLSVFCSIHTIKISQICI
jgi:hypothetical protein